MKKLHKNTVLAVMVLATMLLGSCRQTPTTEYIANKEGSGALISGHQAADNGILLREQVKAPEKKEDEVKTLNEYTTIKINANVSVPENTTVPVYSYTTKHYEEAELQPLAEQLFTDGDITNWVPETTFYTAEELYQKIEDLQVMLDGITITDNEEPVFDHETGNVLECNQEMYDYFVNSKAEYEEMLAKVNDSGNDKTVTYQYEEKNGEYYLVDENDTSSDETVKYTYQNICLQGKKNGLVYDLQIDDDGNNMVLYYTIDLNQNLKNGSSLSHMDCIPMDYNEVGSSNECKYSKEEAEQLVADFLAELGYEGFVAKQVYDLETTLYDGIPMYSSQESKTTNGYGMLLYRGHDGMSEIYDRLAQNDSVYYSFMNTRNNQENDLIMNVMNLEGLMLSENGFTGNGTLNRYKEIVCASVMDDGIVQIAIINPMEEKELLSEHVELIDFNQAYEQALAYLETQYGEGGKYSAQSKVEIKSIQLNYAYMQSPDQENEYTMIPVWDFRSGPDGTTYVTINAIDGTVFDRLQMR